MSKTETAQIKGIALISMFWLHLFGCGSYLTLPQSIWLPVFSNKIALITAEAGPYCLPLFLFCSGYGLYYSFIIRKFTIRNWFYRFLRLLIPYWIIMIASIVYLFFQGSFHPEYLYVNLFALYHDDGMLYVSFSWFIKVYLEIFTLLPIVYLSNSNSMLKRRPLWEVPLYLIVPYLLAEASRSIIFQVKEYPIPFILIYSFNEVMRWLPCFFIGMLSAKHRLFEILWQRTKRIRPILSISLSLCFVSVILFLRYRHLLQKLVVLEWLQAFILVFCFLVLIRSIPVHFSRILTFIGNNSLYYWLLSGFFFLNTSELQFLVFFPKYTLLILLWQFVLETPFVFFFHFISNKLLSLFIRAEE